MAYKASTWVFVLLLMIFCTSFSNANITYTVVASKLIQPYSVVKVVVFISKISDWSNFSASIVHNGIVQYTSDVVVTNATHPPQLLIIPTEDLPEISYSLVFNAVCGENQFYEDKTTVFTVTKQRSILIQTDKIIYQPGEMVRLRVLILNRNLRLLKLQPTADIFVYDSEKHLIKSWTNVTIPKGLFSDKVKLSLRTNLGDWKIDVISGARKESQKFSVIQSIEPKFKVALKLPPFVTFSSSSFIAQIKADYNFEKPISGICVVSLRYYYQYDTKKYANERAIIKTVPIKGVAFVPFDIIKDFGILSDPEDMDFQITAQVTEDIGGKVQEVSELITMYKYAYKMTMLTERETYTPGFPLKITIKVTSQDGTPIIDSNPKAIKVTHGFSYYQEGSVLYSPIPANGLVNFVFETPTNEYLSISNIDVTYKELTQWFPPPKKATSSSSIYLHLSILTEKPTAGNDLEFMVQCNKKFVHIIYMLVSRARILLFEKVLLDTKMNTMNYTIALPANANPTAILLVASIIPPNYVFVVNSIKFPVAPKMENFVNIISPSDFQEPGSNITFQIETRPSSVVALRAVDQSVLEINDLDITVDKLQLELLSYEDEIMHRKDWDTLPAFEIFEDAGMIIITNFQVVKTRLNAVRFMLNEAPMALARIAIESKNHNIGNGDTDNSKLTRKPPETWFFEEIISNESGTASFETRVPDTLNSWIITGYSISDNVSLGVTTTSTQFKTYRPFFISTAIPSSVVEGEFMALQVLVHNFMDTSITAEITLDNSEFKYDFIYSLFKGSQSVTKTVTVKEHEVSFIQFLVKYNTIGVTEIKVKAVVPGVAGDTLTKLIVVKPSGIVQKKTTSVLVATTPTDPFLEQNFTTTFPETRDPGLDKLTVSVIGDILELTVANIDTLLADNVGEQLLFGFALNIVLLKYLNATGKLTPQLKDKLVGYLESGYQRELTFRRFDSSFSAFGDDDISGSAWISSVVIKAFLAAKPFITIDDVIIQEAVAYISQVQREDGSFSEEGDVLFSDTSIANDPVITTFITLSLIEYLKVVPLDESQHSDLQLAIQKSLNYISSINLTEHTCHAINFIAYCLQVANHAQKDLFFEKMESIATKTSNNEVFWKFQLDTPETIEGDHTNYNPKPHEVESTTYAMLVYILRGRISDAMPIFKWLIKQISPYGGFISNQDTIVGLMGLSKMAIILNNDDPDVDIVVQYNTDQSEDFKVQADNAMVLQEKQLPNTVPFVTIKASGNGTALLQISTSYFIAEELQDPNFHINITVLDVDEGEILGLIICGRYSGDVVSNMILMQITLPTGYYFDTYILKDLKNVPKLMHYDTEDDHSILMMYFSFLQTNESICATVNINTEFMLMNHAPGRVSMYDYYDTSKKTIQMYRPPAVDICKICNSEQLCKMDNCD